MFQERLSSHVVDALEDGVRDAEFQDDPALETSHPDLDSTLEMYLGSGDFSYRTRNVNGTTEHLVMRLKKDTWKVHLRIDNDEVKTFDTEELATFLILQVRMDRAMKRRILLVIILFFIIAAPIAAYSVLVLGIGANDDFESFLIGGGVTVAFIPIFCFLMSSAERSVDDSIYADRTNFLEVLQKMINLKEEPYQKRALEQRMERLSPQ